MRVVEEHTVIEPIPKAIEAILYQVFRRSEVKPRINYSNISQLPLLPLIVVHTLVDDALEANHREQTAAHSSTRNEAQDDYSKQASSVAASRLLEKLPVIYGSSHVCRRSKGS